MNLTLYIREEDLLIIETCKFKLEENGESLSRFFARCAADYINGEIESKADAKTKELEDLIKELLRYLGLYELNGQIRSHKDDEEKADEISTTKRIYNR